MMYFCGRYFTKSLESVCGIYNQTNKGREIQFAFSDIEKALDIVQRGKLWAHLVKGDINFKHLKSYTKTTYNHKYVDIA